MIPPHELDTFLVTVEKAVDRAREGNAADGYEALVAGLHRAREAETDGEMWAAAAWVKRAMVDGMAPLIEPVPVGLEVQFGSNWACA
jgi:hypothetical protein